MGDRLRLKCDGTRAETRFSLSTKRTSPFTSAGASVQSTTGSRGVRISGSKAGYTTFRGSVKSTSYPLHSPVSPFNSPSMCHRVPSHFNCTQIIYHAHSLELSPCDFNASELLKKPLKFKANDQVQWFRRQPKAPFPSCHTLPCGSNGLLYKCRP